MPEFVPVLGELPLLPDSFFSVELFARVFVPERGESLTVAVSGPRNEASPSSGDEVEGRKS